MSSYYLLYYYKFSGAPGTKKPSTAEKPRAVMEKPVQEDITWKDRLSFLRRKREGRTKERSRKSLFGSFSTSSPSIPHVDEFIQKKAPHLSKVQSLANRYVAHKDEIQPGLKSHEKGIFAKLESIAKKTKTKKIHEVVSKDEAKDIFTKLKKISKKRKGES